jgi:hypothetical protein
LTVQVLADERQRVVVGIQVSLVSKVQAQKEN